jgi:hypothetical protein
MAHRDRALGRHGVVERGRRTRRHAPACQLGQPLLDGLIKAQVSALHQTQGRDRSYDLRHRLDPHDRAAGHRRPAQRAHPGGDHLGVLALPEHRDDAGGRAAGDVPVEQPLKPLAHGRNCNGRGSERGRQDPCGRVRRGDRAARADAAAGGRSRDRCFIPVTAPASPLASALVARCRIVEAHLCESSSKWRRGWDSNPRSSCPDTAFPVPRPRPD